MGESSGNLGQLVARLAGARHSATPVVTRKHVIVCAADHGIALAGLADKAYSPGALAARQIASGRAAINAVARTAGASVLVVDCGLARHEPPDPGIIDLRIGAVTSDIRRGPAMTNEEALASITTGIAFTLSLADTGTDCIALGQLAPGSRPSSDALAAALGAVAVAESDADDQDSATIRAAFLANQIVVSRQRPASEPEACKQVLDLLAALGGHEIGVMLGIILAASTLHIPVVLDEHGTSIAALLAHRLAPDSTGYVIAAHLGQTAAHRAALAALGLTALVDLGLAYGEGTGAALALPLIDSAARLVSPEGHQLAD